MPISPGQLERNEAFDADPNAGVADEGDEPRDQLDETEQVDQAVEDQPIGPGNETPMAPPKIGLGWGGSF